MAEQNHLEQIRRGVDQWNRWRVQNPLLRPYLGYADLSGLKLARVDPPDDAAEPFEMTRATLRPGLNLSDADLTGTILAKCDLQFGDFRSAYLRNADLREANLYGTDFSRAHLVDADLSGATLINARLSSANLTGAIFTDAVFGSTELCDVDLSHTRNLAHVRHAFPSSLGIDTLYRSGGAIPEPFMLGCGIPQHLLDYLPAFVTDAAVINFYSCFISYSFHDQDFVAKLYHDLTHSQIRCWLATEDLKIGDQLRTKIDESIRLSDKLLLVLSHASIRSQWVEHEVEAALATERRNGATVLFPIRVDDSIMGAESGWAGYIRNTRHIGDFRDWKTESQYSKAIARLKRDLRAEKPRAA